MRLFIDGALQGTATGVSTDLGTTKPMVMGSRFDGASSDLTGRIDDVRVRKGTGVSSAFSAPTASAIVDQYTVLKLSFDGSNASQIVTDDDTFIQDIRFTGGSTATALTLIDHTDFGGEIRSIASACVYGNYGCLLYTSPSPRDVEESRMPSSA